MIVTSPTGAAVRDLLQVTSRRWRCAAILIAPTRVQGAGADREVVAALELANRVAEADVIIVARGGGSLEDLWTFNEESVVRAIVASRLPVVSAVGHEIDVTLADLAADRRALTPSEAGEFCVPDAREVALHLDRLADRLRLAGSRSASRRPRPPRSALPARPPSARPRPPQPPAPRGPARRQPRGPEPPGRARPRLQPDVPGRRQNPGPHQPGCEDRRSDPHPPRSSERSPVALIRVFMISR